MKKLQIFAATIVAVLTVGAIAAAGASAHEWLTLAGAKLTKAESTEFTGTFAFKDTKIGALFGGGEVIVLCMGQLAGTVGTGAASEITLMENLSGGEQDDLECEVSKSTNTVCRTAARVVWLPENLPWRQSLVTINNVLYWDWVTIPAGRLVAWTYRCNNVTVLCGRELEIARFARNNAAGAEFAFEELEKSTCTIGEGFMSGSGTVEKFLAN